jgi:hypothetical protein
MAKTARTALVVVPLGAAASAQAGEVYLPTTPVSCTYNNDGGGGSCSGGASQINTDPGNGIYGVSLYTTSPVFFSSSSGGSLTLSITGNLSGSSGSGISNGTVIPLAYDFMITPVSGSEIPSSWSLDFTVDPLTLGSGTVTVSGSGSGTMEGTTSLTISGGSIAVGTDVTVSAELSWSSVSGSGPGFDISVPGNGTFDVNTASSSTPEPGTMGLLASALAWAGWRFRRRG